MKRKEALYAVVGGCVGAVLTMVVCSFSPLGAQSQSDGNFDMVTCRGLMVEDTYGKSKVLIGVNTISHKGFVLVMDTDGTGVEINSNEDGGSVSVYGKDAKRGVSMGVFPNGGGGIVYVNGKDGEFKALTKVGVR